MDQKRKDKISAINQLLRQSSTSLSRMKLFNQDTTTNPELIFNIAPTNNFNSQYSRVHKYDNSRPLQKSRYIEDEPTCSMCKSRLIQPQLKNSVSSFQPQPREKVVKPAKRMSLVEPLHKLNKKSSEINEHASKYIKPKPSHSPQPRPQMVQGQPNYKKSIWSIPFKAVKDYFEQNSTLVSSKTSPQNVYRLLSPFCQTHQITLPVPLIKQYRNCIYFGQPITTTGKHQGFLIFPSTNKLYYGELFQEKKNGTGTQIDFLNDVIFKGNFSQGKKKGVFTVIKSYQKYEGELHNNNYQGYGKLFTNNSIYKGYFEQGFRHGQGEEHFPETGLTISGTFIFNKFSNNQDAIEESRLKVFKSKELSRNKNHQSFINPEESVSRIKKLNNDHSFQEFNFQFEQNAGRKVKRQQRWNKGNNAFRVRDKKSRSKSPEQKTSEEQDPLDIHC